MIEKETLIYDIETATEFNAPDAKYDKLKLFGCYSYIKDKYYVLHKAIKIGEDKYKIEPDLQAIQKVINAHKILVGFNNAGNRQEQGYDDTVLKRYNINMKYKLILDLLQIIKSRCGAMKTNKGMLGDLLLRFSLDYITKTLDLVDENTSKGDIDYSLFKKDFVTKKELDEMLFYTKRDIEITKKLYEWIENYFESFKSFLLEKDIKNKSYLTCSIAVFGYKALCKELGVKELYSQNFRTDSFDGGYVAFPAGEKFDGNILLFDFSSLYPNLFIMANLFGNNCNCCTEEEKWHGDGFFKVEGYYCKKKLSKLGEVLKKFYLMRRELKKVKDPREYSIKIIINSSYGAVSNPVFQSIHNLVAAEDCTSLGRQFILYARKRFREEGYKLLMTDTDSIAVKLPENKTKEDAQKLASNVVDELQSHLPFPW